MSTLGKESSPKSATTENKDAGASTFPAKLGMVVCLTLAVLFLIKPVRRYLNAKEAVRVSEQVKRSSESYRYDEAYVGLQKALELAPDRLEVVQAAADLLTRREDPSALQFWQSLIQAGKATQQDRVRLVELAMKLGRFDIASPALVELRKEDPNSPELRFLEIRLKVQMDESSGASALAEDWLAKNPAQEIAHLAVGWVRSRQPNAAVRADGRRLLMVVANSQSPWRLQALQALSQDPELNRAELQMVSRALETVKNPSPEQQLSMADLRLRLDDTKHPEIVGSIVELSKTLDTSQLLRVANWLELHKALSLVPTALPLDRVRTNGPLLMVRLQTLAWLGDTAEVEQQLSDSMAPIDPLQRLIIRSTVATRKKPPEDPTPVLQEALKLAGTNGLMMANIAMHALRLQLTNSAIEIYAQLATKPSHTVSATAEILRLLDESTPTPGIRDRLRELSRQQPSVTQFAMEACYFDLLLKENVSNCRVELTSLATKNAESLRIRLSLALADLIEKQPQAAMARLGNDSMAWSRAAPRWQAIHAAILGQNGKIDQAKAAAKSIDRSRLRPEELAWILPWQ